MPPGIFSNRLLDFRVSIFRMRIMDMLQEYVGNLFAGKLGVF
jgi:hypothetical protein